MTLRDDLETEIMFSELRCNKILQTKKLLINFNYSYRCKKILPTAMAAYKEGLPQHYTQEYHQVIRLFVEH